jgi:ABC-type nitrate/sulfonate/bicarbonate transport system ATPase subunit
MILEAKQITFEYQGKRVLDGLDFTVGHNEFVALTGVSGCGKSTLLSILAGVLPPGAGEVIVDGEVIKGINRHAAYMPQSDLLFPWATILDNVTLYGRLNKDKKAAYSRALSLFERFGLAGYETAYPHQLSGGMRARAAFLRTALSPAEVLLLDEPFAALDAITRLEMQDFLASLRSDLNRTTILVTHDINEAKRLADRILVMKDGKMYEYDDL